MECLKITLKGEVQDEYIPYFGELFFKVKVENAGDGGKRFYFSNRKAGKMRVVGEGSFIVNGVEKKEINYGTDVYLSNGEYYLGLSEKYSLVTAQTLQNVDTSELRYCADIPNGVAFGNGCTGTLADIANQTHIRIETPFITGSSSDLVNNAGLRRFYITRGRDRESNISVDLGDFQGKANIEIINCEIGDNLTGSLDDVSDMINLVELGGYENHEVEGEIQDLAVYQWATKNRKSGKLSIKNLSGTTINGVSSSNWRHDIVFGENSIIIKSFDSTEPEGTPIRMYDGTGWSDISS